MEASTTKNLGITGSITKAMLCVGISVLVWPLAARSQAGPEIAPFSASRWDPSKLGAPLLRDPIWVYNDWSAYDELSDNIPLTEDLAMRELNEILRLRKLGVHFDYYMMDAFWFAKDGAYRTWRTPNWPSGPDHWIAECKKTEFSPACGLAATNL
jgi:hypothetical protein